MGLVRDAGCDIAEECERRLRVPASSANKVLHALLGRRIPPHGTGERTKCACVHTSHTYIGAWVHTNYEMGIIFTLPHKKAFPRAQVCQNTGARRQDVREVGSGYVGSGASQGAW